LLQHFYFLNNKHNYQQTTTGKNYKVLDRDLTVTYVPKISRFEKQTSARYIYGLMISI